MNNPTTMKPRHTADYRITLHAQTADVPALIRLKALLKVALRRYRFKCTGLEEILVVPVIERTNSDKEEILKIMFETDDEGVTDDATTTSASTSGNF